MTISPDPRCGHTGRLKLSEQSIHTSDSLNVFFEHEGFMPHQVSKHGSRKSPHLVNM